MRAPCRIHIILLFFLTLGHLSFGQTAKEYVQRARTEKENNNGNACREYLEKAIALDPKNAEAYYEMGKLYNMAKNFKEAIEYYNKSISLDSSFADPYLGKAEIFFRASGKYVEEGCKSAKKAKELGHPKAQNLLDKYCKEN